MDLGRDKIVADIISRLKTPPAASLLPAAPSCDGSRGGRRSKTAGEGAVTVEGAWGSFAPMLACYISEKIAKPILYI